MKTPQLRLISPDDGSPLREIEGGFADRSGNVYRSVGGIPNLTPLRPVSGSIPYVLRPHKFFRAFPYQETLKPLYPRETVHSVELKELNLSGFIPPVEGKRFCLDHGCGGGKLRRFLESFGYTYVGVDNESGVSTEQGGGEQFGGGATHFCDLHRLPFENDTFTFSVSYSVFEHLQNPFVAAAELFRVMKPGGIAFAVVAAMMPFHMDSFYHHTHFGILATFSNAGFEVDQVAGANFNAYRALGAMDGLPGPRWLRRLVTEPVYGAHRLLWMLRSRMKGRARTEEELRRHLMMAGLVKAILRKPSLT